MLKIVFLTSLLFTAVALNAASQPEVNVAKLAQASTQEYPLLKKLSDLALELQVIDFSLKNKKDPSLSLKIDEALKKIDDEQNRTKQEFDRIRNLQLTALYQLFELVKQNQSPALYADSAELLAVFEFFRNPNDPSLPAPIAYNVQQQMVSIKLGQKSYNFIKAIPISSGRNILFHYKPVELNAQSAWWYLNNRRKTFTMAQTNFSKLEQLSAEANMLAQKFYVFCFNTLFQAFETHRNAILSRVREAEKTVQEIAKTSSAIGLSDSYVLLINQMLENFYTFGLDLNLNAKIFSPQNSLVKGFIFGENQEKAREALNQIKLKNQSLN